jgi:beta-glucosidase
MFHFDCTLPPPVSQGKRCVTFSVGGANATALAKTADVAIVFGYATSSEGSDRDDLSLAADGDALIASISAVQPNTVAVAVAPGAILTPWLDDVAAALVLFMPGQEYGNAVRDLVFGHVNPSGKLPLTFPNKENEVGFTPAQWPGVNGDATYTERMEIGYRWYDAHDVTPKLCFGHGLSYTSFAYTDAKVGADGRSMSFTLANTGKVAGKEVVQVYVAAPQRAEEPPLQLKQFKKVALDAGAETVVSMHLDDAAFSVWDVNAHSWQIVHGVHTLHVGSSSRDLRVSLRIEV